MEGGTKIMQLRVMISPNNARRIDLPSRPESVEELKAILQNQLELRDGFRLQYEDALFGNSLCNLHHINELPDGRAVLKVIWDDELTLEIIPAPSDAGSLSFDPGSPSSSTSSIMTSPNTSQHLRDATHWPSLDTASPSSSTSSIMTSPNTSKHLRVTTHWPSSFDVPKFSIDVELRLKKANDSYSQTKVPLVVPRDMKSEILSKLVQALFEIRPYPSRDEVETAVIALVQKHPCLAEEKPSSGWDAWLSSLWFKVGNYRYKLRQAGMPEVAINRKRHGEDGVTKFNLKKSRRAEVNFVPDHPEGQTKETLEEERLEMIEEMKKKNVDTSLVQQKMHSTFSLRRREIVEVQPLVQEIKERWPAMFLTDEYNELLEM
ncbi:uncharacterized protein LOC134436458 [Engraulis encrasicolus]|uniref:uncharacterized protein LOC134436458 n=1 Tax=Engraulis encrasicolus TaxID=184585 RepID=UPI002FCF3B8C